MSEPLRGTVGSKTTIRSHLEEPIREIWWAFLLMGEQRRGIRYSAVLSYLSSYFGLYTPSSVEVTQISPNGVWILVKGEEFFMFFENSPWFQNSTVAQIHNVQLLHGAHLRWSDLDVDLHVDSLKSLEKYPLTYIS